MRLSLSNQADAEHEGCCEAITEYVNSLSDAEGLLHALKNDHALCTLVCNLMDWVTDPMVGKDMRGKNLLLIGNQIERHARQYAECKFMEGANAATADRAEARREARSVA